MRRGFNTLFVRLALTSLAVVLLVQAGSMAIMIVQRPRHDLDGFARGVLLVLETAHLHEPGASGAAVPWTGESWPGTPGWWGITPGPRNTGRSGLHPPPRETPEADGPDGFRFDHLDALPPDGARPPGSPPEAPGNEDRPPGPPPDEIPMHRPMRVRYVGVSASEARGLSATSEILYSNLVRILIAHLPSGTAIRFEKTPTPSLWAHFPGSAFWIVIPIDPPPTPPFLLEFGAMTLASIVLALLAAWQLQLPVARVAQAARAFGRARRLPPVEPSGPQELRDLATAFNDMMRRVEDAESSQAVMLAGVAHDLKSPLMRLRLRADLLGDSSERIGFLRDVESLTHIVEQFLLFADETPTQGPHVKVDASLRAQFGDVDAFEVTPGGELFKLSLEAGDDFVLPRTLLDRLIGNLVDNALDHGEPPVEITTRRDGENWLIEIRDHGTGIEPEKISNAVLPFVRLDASRGGDGHCGLGLAIVQRLAHQNAGECVIRNAEDSGLVVTLRFRSNEFIG
jgi:two-component system, OmpR family, osmolarity sensor histidine kinase EnvZ